MKLTFSRKWWISIGVTVGLVALLGATGAAVAQKSIRGDAVAATTVTLDPGGGPSESMAFTYQGRLVEGGVPANGNYDFIINLYNNSTVGSPVASCTNVGTGSLLNQPVTNGIFTFYLYCGSSNSSAFTGGERWIEVQVRPTGGTTYTTLPRQPISPTPYAFSLYPGAVISSTAWGYDFGDSIVNIRNNNVLYSALHVQAASGSAVRAESANGIPIAGSTETGYGVYGYDGGTTQARGYGGYFYSANGVGVYGKSDGARAHPNSYAPGVYGRSADGVGVYGVSESSASWIPGVLGESTTGTGVAGNSTDNYGLYGYSTNNNGVYGYSRNNAAGYFYSYNHRGVEATSNSSYFVGYFDNPGGSTSPGVYVDGTLNVTGGKTGYVVDLVRNAGPEPLETGDVVEIVGAEPPVNGEIPVVLVRKASQAASTSIAGIIDQPYVIPDKKGAQGETLPHPGAARALTAQNTAILSGEYGSMVTLGSFKEIKVDASYGAIHPGDLLVASSRPGYAMRSANPRVGAVLGKALDTLESGTGTIPVMISLK